jgi:membrane-associated phospholipid phosphatase
LPGFLVRLPAPPDASPAVAVAAAAHTMLCLLFPDQRAALDAAFAGYLASDADSIARQRSIAFGDAVAQAVFMRRAEDGAAGAVARPDGLGAGQWRPTPPDYLDPSHTEWAAMQPFAMTSPGQFRPPGPPPPDSAAFHAAKAVVAAVGALRSTVRTAEQTQIARYWSDAIGSYAPSGHWNAIAATIMAPLRLGLDVEAQRFAELNVALADAGVAVADAKYTYWFWRPVTAIHAGDATDPPDPAWMPLLETPNHPSYISGHSAFSGAAAAVLTQRLGDRAFTFASDSLPGVARAFSSFQQAAEEAASSRLYGGIHYPFDNADGLATGKAVGTWVIATFDRQATDRGPFLMVETDAGSRAIIGCALDNLAPVSMVQARLDDGAPFNLMVDDKGWFTVPPLRLGNDRRHAIVVAATSQSGLTSTTRMDIPGAGARQ